jgi:uncharacterized protein YigE (DUF2233 family)
MRALASSAEPCFPTKSDDGDLMLRVLKRFALGLASCLLTQPSFAIDESVEVVEVGETRYLIYRIPRADLARLELHWLDQRDQPLVNFGALQQHLADQGKEIQFATNAGIYERGPKPCGLTIGQGREWVPLNLAAGEGNFYLRPNGVFFVDDQKGAGVMESGEYAKAGLQPRLATQSGPLLLRHRVIHPAFNPNSSNLRQRSAVGVRKEDGEVVFVVTDRKDPEKRRVSFHQLATFFLSLGCDDALFLDGDLSDFAVNPPAKAQFRPQTYAAMMVLVKK